jgi:NAD-dependent DNA ligase
MAELVKNMNLSHDSIEFISKLSNEELEKIITWTADKYYNTTKPVVTDAIYDILIDFLKLQNPKSQVLKNIGAKSKSKHVVALDYWLGSMDKIKPPSNQLAIWMNKYKPPYNLSDKLDGVSALITYKLDGTVGMYTRGTADEGTNITHLIKYIAIPDYKTVAKFCDENKICGTKNLIAFRGELIIAKETFKKNWGKVMKNPRNTIIGLVNSKTINPELARDTNLVVYEIVDPFYPVDVQYAFIKGIGFITAPNKNINQELNFQLLSTYLKERKIKSKYDIDGIIVTCIKNNYRNQSGNPEYAFAFKDILEEQLGKTTVISIEWNESKDGLIKPTLILKPVNIGGVDIQRATGFNAKFIVDNVLGPGAEIEIIRSGDVIPKVQSVLKPAKSGMPCLPKGKWSWNTTNVDIIVADKQNNKQVLIKNIYHFFSTLNTKGLGEKIVEKLVDANINTVKKIIEATECELLDVDGFKTKSATNLISSIKKALTNIPLSKLMAASNKIGHGIGEERMKQVLTVYPNILSDYKKWSFSEFVDKLKQLDGWEEKTATLLATNFIAFVEFYDGIKKYVSLEVKQTNVTNGIFTGKTVVMTGFRNKVLQDKIEAQGGKNGSTISKNTDYLVVKDQTFISSPTDKVLKATELGVKIITQDKLISMLA